MYTLLPTMLPNLTNIKQTRLQQLNTQYNIDKELSKINSCPDIVAKYLLLQRDLSRTQQHEMINTNILNIPKLLEKQFQENEEIYNKFYQILKCENICECLSKIC